MNSEEQKSPPANGQGVEVRMQQAVLMQYMTKGLLQIHQQLQVSLKNFPY